MTLKFRERQRALNEKKLMILRQKQDKKAQQETKQYTQKVRLTTKIHEVGGGGFEQVQLMFQIFNKCRVKVRYLLKDAIVLPVQLQFRKTVLGSKGPREKIPRVVLR